MATSETVLERAVTLASLRTETDDAVEDLLAVCGSNRVAVVRAQREISQRAEEEPGDLSVARALELLDETLRLGPWDVA
jgi:hypothetical protein